MRSPLPAMSAEERTRALEIANQARRERAELKRNMKAGRITPKTALDAKAAQRMRVEDFLASLPGIGKAKARKIMVAVGIAPNRRVRGSGDGSGNGLSMRSPTRMASGKTKEVNHELQLR